MSGLVSCPAIIGLPIRALFRPCFLVMMQSFGLLLHLSVFLGFFFFLHTASSANVLALLILTHSVGNKVVSLNEGGWGCKM